jgi:hypothetical protein
MRLHRTFLALLLLGAPSRILAQEVTGPMAPFARMVGGEWKMTALAGTSTYDIWHWGPGKHSVRVMTHGIDPERKPWRELQVFYWHPGRKQVRYLGLSPVLQGVSEGTIKFDGDTAVGVFVIHQFHQTYGRRKMGLRWTFDGPDKYHDVLLEASGPEGLKPMNEWDHFRSMTLTPVRPIIAEEMPKYPEYLKPLEPLVGHTFEATGEWAVGDTVHIQTTFEWVPFTVGIYARTVALTKESEPTLPLESYIFHHTETGGLRCLAL